MWVQNLAGEDPNERSQWQRVLRTSGTASRLPWQPFVKLDQLLRAAGRQPAEVKRSVMITVMVWRTPQEFERMLESLRRIPIYAAATAEGLSSVMASRNGIIGAPEQVVERMRAYAEAGVDEFVIQWIDP